MNSNWRMAVGAELEGRSSSDEGERGRNYSLVIVYRIILVKCVIQGGSNYSNNKTKKNIILGRHRRGRGKGRQE